MKRSLTVAALIFGLMLPLARPSFADVDPPAPAEDKADATLSPYFFVEGADASVDRLPLKETHASVHIAGVIADVVVSQVYRNEGSRALHARYVFPASTRAAVHGMTLQVGKQIIRAQIKERQAAKQVYEEAKAAGKSAALLEEQRPNVFSMNVANILPGDEIQVELHYSELLIPTDGTYEFVYPTVVGPRYSSQEEKAAGERDQWVKSPYLHQGEAPSYKFGIDTEIAAGMPIEELACASHKAHVDWQNPTAAKVALDPGETDGGNRDYILRYRLQGKQVETGLLLYPGTGKDESFFLLMVQPPARVIPTQIPPREYIFVLDVSGSMSGFPLDTAKTVMRELIGGLRPIDRFNVILFSGGSRILAPKSLSASPANVQMAIAEIEREQGGGGTELGQALSQALALPEERGVSRSTIVVTDGFIEAEADVFDRIRTSLNHSNLFAFGIGSSVNRHLIEGMAHAGQGEPFVVTTPAEAPAAARRFEEYIKSPVLTDVAVEADGFHVFDVEPPSIPDLFADRPLVIFGKWKGPAGGTIKVTGTGGDGGYEKVFDVAQAASSADNRVLRYLWARARVARLSDFGSEQNEETQREVTALGLGYELLTAYTSFVAVHDVVRNANAGNGDTPSVDQALPLPAGVEDSAVGNAVPEPELVVLALGALLLFGLVRFATASRSGGWV